MKKLNLLKSLILITIVLTGTTKAFANADLVQTLSVSVPESVSIEKIGSLEVGEINPRTGEHAGLNSSFLLKTNNMDYDFIVASKITTTDGEISAYTANGELLFANATILPTLQAAKNAKAGDRDNANIIVYPVTIENLEGTMNIDYNNSITTNEGTGAYLVSITSGTTGKIIQSVGTTPVNNSYSLGGDQAGSYKCTVYVTAVSK